jgi:glycosyltransferase involved in cell wall biosynthesis
VTLDDTVPDAMPWMPMKQRAGLLHRLQRTVARHKPDHVLVPSADGQTTAMGPMRLVARGTLGASASGARVRGEAGIHIGLGTAARTRKEQLKSLVYELCCATSTWDRVHFVNPLLHEAVTRRFPGVAHRCVVFPHPVLGFPGGDRAHTRAALGVPLDGRYVGFAGKLDERKAIDALLLAFRDGSSTGDRLLIAGELCDRWRGLVEREYRDLVDARRVIVLDRFLSNDEFAMLYAALDIVAVPYPEYGLVSGTLLEAAIAGRPVLASHLGWSGMMTRRFSLGWSCPMRDRARFADAMRAALDGCGGFNPSPAAERLVEFHRPANFARCWTAGIRDRLGLAPDPAHRSWSWATELAVP